jgi:hypothetical protein
MNPAGKVRCHIRKQIESAAVIATHANQPYGHDPGGSGATRSAPCLINALG